MATNSPSTYSARWTSAHENYSIAQLAWDAVADQGPCSARDDVESAMNRARSTLLASPAPSIAQVIQKLELWWGETLLDNRYSSSANRIIIGDLRRLALLAAGVDAADATGRTPEEMADVGKAWRAALADYTEQEQLFTEGPSSRWEDREPIDIVNAIDYAAGVLLELPAPSLGAVVRKLELLWEVDRFDTLEEGGLYLQIVGDLNRLTRSAEVEPAKPQ